MVILMKMMNLVLVILSVSLLPNIGLAAEVPICPQEIQTGQQPLEKIKGWEYSNHEIKHTLNWVIFYDGHPSKKRALIYDEEREGKEGNILIWHFPGDQWVECGYNGTTVALIKQIPDGIHRCEVTHVRSEISKITCK